MNGMEFYMKRQGRSTAELAKVTDLPERQLREMLEERTFEKPSHFYMRLAAALGIPLEQLLRNIPEDENCGTEERRGMVWKDWFERRPGTICRIYLARITGAHAEYRYSRTFCRLTYHYSERNIHCCIEGLEEGVYEVYARWYDASTGDLVHRRRSWFAAVDEAFYDLEEQDVLPASLGFDALKKRGGAA